MTNDLLEWRRLRVGIQVKHFFLKKEIEKLKIAEGLRNILEWSI